MKSTTLNQIMELSVELKEKASKTLEDITIARNCHANHLYLIYAVDQYKRFGHLRCDVAAEQGATWFGDFTVVQDLPKAEASAEYYYERQKESYEEYVSLRNKLKKLINKDT